MVESGLDFSVIVLLVGVVTVISLMVKALLGKTGVPALVGYLALGLLIRILDQNLNLLSAGGREIFEFLAQVGLVTLLFRIGLDSNLQGLLHQLQRASIAWLVGVLISGFIGFLTAFYILGLNQVAGLVVATAFTATSVGISVAVWQEMNALQSANGEFLIDLAELDDISAVVLMALLFALLPALSGDLHVSAMRLLAGETLFFLAKIVAFGTLCFLFSKYAERRITRFFREVERSPDPMVTVAGIGLVIAAVAGLLGFSLAIGAFFAGLVFSRDPKTVQMEASFLPLYALFSPFFFIGIGLKLDPQSLTTALELSGVLLCAAVVAKLVGHGVPVWAMSEFKSGILIGASMVPRAEITMVIMQRGLAKGVVSPQAFGAMIVVCAATCTFSPMVVKSLLNRWPQNGEQR